MLEQGWNDYFNYYSGRLVYRQPDVLLLKLFLMKKTSFFYHVLIVWALCGFMFCGNNANNTDDTIKSDSAMKLESDSMNAAHHNDPSTAYPQPPVTGTTQDSSRSKDSVKQ
jgi:hypothetical protein